MPHDPNVFGPAEAIDTEFDEQFGIFDFDDMFPPQQSPAGAVDEEESDFGFSDLWS